ncbi:MAG TPA: hypothetical protein VGF84_19170 [Micromonosporaceae bacterium]|jgi:hypothetical protein
MKSALRVLVVVGLAATLAACSKTATEAGSSGLSGISASSSASASTGASTGPTVAPTPTKTKSGSGSGSTAAPSPSVSSASPSTSSIVIKGGGPLDYKVVATGNCFWKLYDDGGNMEVQIGAQFEATVSRRLPRAGTVPMTVTNSLDNDNTSGSAPLGTPVSWSLGSELVSQNEFGGKTVVLKATISPTGTDSNPNDNVATVSVAVPAGSPPSTSPTSLSC